MKRKNKDRKWRVRCHKTLHLPRNLCSLGYFSGNHVWWERLTQLGCKHLELSTLETAWVRSSRSHRALLTNGRSSTSYSVSSHRIYHARWPEPVPVAVATTRERYTTGVWFWSSLEISEHIGREISGFVSARKKSGRVDLSTGGRAPNVADGYAPPRNQIGARGGGGCKSLCPPTVSQTKSSYHAGVCVCCVGSQQLSSYEEACVNVIGVRTMPKTTTNAGSNIWDLLTDICSSSSKSYMPPRPKAPRTWSLCVVFICRCGTNLIGR